MTRLITGSILLAALASCGSPQQVERRSVRGLLGNGLYDEALAEAERLVGLEPGDPGRLAVLAVAQAAKAAPAGSSAQARQTLERAAAAGSKGRAVDDFVTEAAGSRAFQGERFAIAAQAVLAPVEGFAPERGDTDAIRAAGALLILATHGAESAGEPEAVRRLLGTATTLLGRATDRHAFESSDMRTGWLVFRAAGNLADAASRRRNRELAWSAAELAVSIAEANPELSIPIMCDLGSPRDALRGVLSYDRVILSRFEDAIAGASGCTPGAYAP